MILCCKGCVPPKRHPGCHDHCPEYLEEKRKDLERKEIEDRERRVAIDLYIERSRSINRARKKRRRY